MKIYQALFLAAAVAKVSAAPTADDLPAVSSKPVDWTRTNDVTGRPSKPNGDENSVSGRPSKPDGDSVTSRPSKPDGERPNGGTGPFTDKPDGDKTKDRTHPGEVTGRPSKPKDGTGHPFVAKPDGDRSKDRPDCQTAEGLDERATQYCCFKGIFTGDAKCPEGDKDRSSAMCEKGHSTTTAATTNARSILDEVKKGLACRPIRNEKKQDGDDANKGTGDKEGDMLGRLKPQAEDPRRNTQALAEKAKDLSANGKKCVSNLKLAIESVKTLLHQWKGDPTRKPIKDTNKLDKDTVSDTFYDAVEIAAGAEKLYNDFDAKSIDRTANELLPAKEGDDDAPRQCKAEWENYRGELGELVEGFKRLPTKFKEAKVERVQIALKDIDLGAVDWTSEENVCNFSKELMAKMRGVQKDLNTKLQHIRGALCTEGSKLAAGPKVGALAGCLREKRKTNPEDAGANDEVYERIRGKTNKIFAQIQSKCVAKPKDSDDNSEAVQPSVKTKRTIGMRIKKACTAAENKQECKDRVMVKIRDAFKTQNPDAEVAVRVTDDIGDNSRWRRLSEGALNAQVDITQIGAQLNPDYEGGVVAALGNAVVEVASDTTTGTENIAPPADLNMDINNPTVRVTTQTSLRTAASAGSAARVAMGAAAAVCVALVSILL